MPRPRSFFWVKNGFPGGLPPQTPPGATHGAPLSVLPLFQPPVERLFQAIAPAKQNWVWGCPFPSPEACQLVPTEGREAPDLSLPAILGSARLAAGHAGCQALGVGRPAQASDLGQGQEMQRASIRTILCVTLGTLPSF